MASRVSRLGQAVLDLIIDDSKFHSKLSGAYKAAQSFTAQTGKDLQKAGKAISGLGESWTRNITAPIAVAGGVVTKFGLDFDTTMRQIVGLTDVTADEIGGIREELLKLGPEVGKGPQELAESFYFIASAGFEADEAMEVLRASAQAAASGLGETQAVAQVVGSVINAYGKENLDAATAVGQLIEAISQGTAEAPEFAAVLGRVAPTAAALGVNFDQVAASLAGMTLTGLSAEESATSLNQVLISLLKPTADAEKALSEMGLSASGLRQQLKEEGLLSVLRTLEERFAGNDEAAARVFGNVRALRGVTSLLRLDTEQLNTIFEKVADSGAPRLAAAYEATEGPQRDLDRAMADLQATAITLGADVLPMVVEVMEGLAAGARDLRAWWDSLDDGTRDLIVRSLGFIAVAGPVLVIVGKLVAGVGALFSAIGFITGAKGIPLLVKRLKALQLAALGPIGAIAAVGFVLHEAFGGNDVPKRLERIEDELEAVGGTADEMKEAFDRSGLGVAEFSQKVIDLIDDGMNVRDALREVSGAADEQRETLKRLEEGYPSASSAAREWSEEQKRAYAEAFGGAKESLDALPPEVREALVNAGIVVDEEAGEAFDGVSEEAHKAREAAVAEMRQMLNDLTNLFDTEDDLIKAWQDLIERMDDPYTEAERKADVFSKNTIDNIRAALKSGDPAVAADAALLVNNMLTQIAAMEPGALESGEAVPPAIRDGMDAQMSALIAWIEQHVTGESLAAMDLSEAEELGLDGIWRYAQGMQRNAIIATSEARNIALRSKEALAAPDYFGAGKGAMADFGAGISAGKEIALSHAKLAANAIKGIFPSSEPKDPSSPLRGITKAWGFTEVLARGMTRDLGPLKRAMTTVADVMTVDPTGLSGLSVRAPTLPGMAEWDALSPVGRGDGQVAGITTIYQYILNANGEPVRVGDRDEVLDAWERMSGFTGR